MPLSIKLSSIKPSANHRGFWGATAQLVLLGGLNLLILAEKRMLAWGRSGGGAVAPWDDAVILLKFDWGERKGHVMLL